MVLTCFYTFGFWTHLTFSFNSLDNHQLNDLITKITLAYRFPIVEAFGHCCFYYGCLKYMQTNTTSEIWCGSLSLLREAPPFVCCDRRNFLYI